MRKKLWRSNKMRFFTLLLLLTTPLLATCEEQRKSQLVVLYKYSIAPGNSVVSFINKDDETGKLAAVHCEKLRRLYIAEEKMNFICSTVVFDEFKPSIK